MRIQFDNELMDKLMAASRRADKGAHVVVREAVEEYLKNHSEVKNNERRSKR